MALRIIAYTSTVESGTVVIRNSEDGSITSNNPQELLEFIGENYTDSEVPYREMKVTFDLDQFIAPILRLLPMSQIRELSSPKHQSGNIFYIPSKLLSLETKEHKSYLYHLAQYFEDMDEPTDPLLIAGLGTDIVEAYKQMGMSPYKLTSPVAVYEAEILNHCQIPTILDLPGAKEEEVIDFAEACIGRLWISAFQVGHWETEEVYSYDVQSSFPFWASQLYSIKYANFAKSKYLCPDAQWGFIKGRITINDNVKVHPILHKNDKGDIINPCGSWEDIITLQEWEFINKWKIGTFEPIEGWYIKFNAPVKPLEIPLQRLFNLRHKGGLVKALAKRMATGGCYGKFIEHHDDGTVGKYYNPLWAAMVSTLARLQVAEFIYTHELQNDLIHIGVDGLLSSKYVPIKEKVAMGYWRLNPPSSALVLSPGRVYTGDKKPQGLNYNMIMQMIKSRPRDSYYSTILRRRQTLAESVELNDLAHLGIIKDTHSSLDLNLLRTGQDRIFKDFPHTGGELIANKYPSSPYEIAEPS